MWFPVNEKLPEAFTSVIVQAECGALFFAEMHEDGLFYEDDHEYNRKIEAVAWMPLPERYKGNQ